MAHSIVEHHINTQNEILQWSVQDIVVYNLMWVEAHKPTLNPQENSKPIIHIQQWWFQGTKCCLKIFKDVCSLESIDDCSQRVTTMCKGSMAKHGGRSPRNNSHTTNILLKPRIQIEWTTLI